MELYIVFEHELHAESYFRGVFSTKETAQAYVETLTARYGSEYTRFDYEIAQLDVGQ